ncbi:hypothetical protein GOP47_0017810 [Adiantum capillus-veneris]|uniref:Uncharacterized protein n=1 Tax=Adiantum capillus-veneris TaxID=13818 RepID=A0A9D4ZAX5_ADICA|nr:hypothetical protein GOP47_0017810 [Adiantum capillus-veneris]
MVRSLKGGGGEKKGARESQLKDPLSAPTPICHSSFSIASSAEEAGSLHSHRPPVRLWPRLCSFYVGLTPAQAPP